MAGKQSEKKTYFNLPEEWEVTNARRLEFGTYFTLQLPGLALYNLRIVPAGKKYSAFIAMPDDKAKDGNYYKRFALYLSEEDTEAVIDAVEDLLENSRKTTKRK